MQATQEKTTVNDGGVNAEAQDKVQVIAEMSVNHDGVLVDGEKVDPNKPIKSVSFIGSISVGGGIQVSGPTLELGGGSQERQKMSDPRMFGSHKMSEHQPLMQYTQPTPAEESCSCRIL